MAINQGYDSQTVTVGSISDSLLQKPSGSGALQITPVIPGAIVQTAANTLPSPVAAYYTKSSSTSLTLTLPSAPGFTTGSLMGIFWTDSGGVERFQIDCVIASITGAVVVITGSGSPPSGQSTFATITPGTTVVTFSVANLATTDQPGNTDITDYVIPSAAILQLLLSCNTTGAFELFATPVGTLGNTVGAWVSTGPTLTVSGAGWVVNALAGLTFTIGGNSYTCVSNTATVATMSGAGSTSTGTVTWSITSPNSVLVWNYAAPGDFYNWIVGQTVPYAGNVTKLRFYNSTLAAQAMKVGALIA